MMYIKSLYKGLKMQTAIKKWGNSLAIRIPNHILKALALEEESVLDIALQNNKIVLKKKQDLQSLCQEITQDNLNIFIEWGKSSMGKEFDF